MDQTNKLDFTAIMNLLNQASGFELHRLQCAIQHRLEETTWIAPIRQQLCLGQMIEYFDPKKNRLQPAIITEFKPKKILVKNTLDNQLYAIPYTWINIDGRDILVRESNTRGLGRNEISVGDYLGFRDKEGRELSGKVIRLNPKTASIIVGNQKWSVSYSLLHRVMETDTFSSCMDGDYTLIMD